MIDLEMSHDEFKTIVDDKEKYEKRKEGIKIIKSSDELNKECKKIQTIEYGWKDWKCIELKSNIFSNKYKMVAILKEQWEKMVQK